MEVGKSVKPDELFIKVIKDELVDLLGGDHKELYVDGKPSVLLLCGLQGSGKTTSAGKLANFLRKKHSKNPLLVACDIYRPAAIEQLQTIGKSLGITVYTEGKNNPVEITKNAIEFAKQNNHDYIIIDTAGRLQVDEELMEELDNIKNDKDLFINLYGKEEEIAKYLEISERVNVINADHKLETKTTDYKLLPLFRNLRIFFFRK